MKITRLLPTFTALAFGTIAPLHAAEPITLKLWPDGPPSAMAPKSEATIKQIASYGPITPTHVSDVTDPTITIFRPEKPNGASVVVAPGGGYMFLSYASEGTQVCEWLNTLGVTAVLLKYRTPTRDEKDAFTMPVQDAQRAIGIVRHHAAEWSLDPKRVGLLGFSAGGNLTGHAAWDRGERTYLQKPDFDDARPPDFIVFVYGGGFLDKDDKTKFRAGFSVPADAPPAFFVVAHDDKSNPIEATRLYLEYKKHNIPAELHIMTKGGHGFGIKLDFLVRERARELARSQGFSTKVIKPEGAPINDWPARCGEWLGAMGYLSAK